MMRCHDTMPTYPRAHLSQTGAVHSLRAGQVRHGNVHISVGALKHLVTQLSLARHLTQLEGGLDLLHVLKVSSVGVLGVQDDVDNVVGVKESAGNGVRTDVSTLCDTNSTEMTIIHENEY